MYPRSLISLIAAGALLLNAPTVNGGNPFKWTWHKIKGAGKWVGKEIVNVIDPMPPQIMRLPPTTQFGILVYDWVGVIDNGEGDDWPHGPYGNLHIQVFESNGNQVLHQVIHGPSRNEWLDGDDSFYGPGIILYNWQRSDDFVRVIIWESDQGGPLLGRAHDVLFDVLLPREATLSSTLFFDPRRLAANDALRNATNRNPAWYQELLAKKEQDSAIAAMYVSLRTLPSPTPRQVPCVHRIPCIHTIPCIHRQPCQHSMRCAHWVKSPTGMRAAHPFDFMHQFDFVHNGDAAHAYDLQHPYDLAR